MERVEMVIEILCNLLVIGIIFRFMVRDGLLNEFKFLFKDLTRGGKLD